MLNNVYHLAYILCAPVGGTLMIALNVLTIFIFVRVFRLQSFTLILMVNICLCDIFVCLFSNMFYVGNLVHPNHAWSTGDSACRIFRTVTMFTNVSQIYSLCAVNADRMRRVVYATSTQWKKIHSYWVLTVVWVVSAILTTPRLFLFEEKEVTRLVPDSNVTTLFDTNITAKDAKRVVVNVVCKPTDVNATWYIAATLVLFVAAYVLPSCHILYTSARVQLFMRTWKKNQLVNEFQLSTKRMNHALSLTFNLTAGLFLAIWSPFFILSVTDLVENMLKKKGLTGANFTLRCTLLILGSAKPIIYIICLEKFRRAFKCCYGPGKRLKGSTSGTSGQQSDSGTNPTQ